MESPIPCISRYETWSKPFLSTNTPWGARWSADRIILQRDQVRLGLTENGGNPEEQSCAISVSDVDGLHQELRVQSLHISDIRLDTYDNHPFRVFFLRAPDGLCFCFTQPAQEQSEN